MSRIAIRLPKDLKTRVAAAAERAGTTPHGFMLQAIAEKTDEAERRADFHGVADKRYSELLASGKTIAWKKMRGDLEARVESPARRPKARKPSR